MEGNRSVIRAAELAALAVAAASVAAGCGIIERTEPPSDEQDETGPFEQPARITEIAPSSDTVSTTPRLEITFDSYLEDDAFNTFNTGSFRSGGLGWGGWADWVVTDKKLVWVARDSIPPGLDIQFSLADRLETVTGAPIADRKQIARFRTDDERETRDREQLPAPRWSDVDAIFGKHCRECHGDPSWDLVDLQRAPLVDEASSQVDRQLVKPYDPADSYLLQKVLWDYPEIRYSPQPPPWSGGEELSREEKLTIERWIEVGAPGGAEF